MDPEKEDRNDDRVMAPKVESYSSLRARITEEAHAGMRPSPSEDAIIMLHSSLYRDAEIRLVSYTERFQKEQAMRNLIMITVRAEIYELVMHRVTTTYPSGDGHPVTKSRHTIRQLLRALQEEMGITKEEMKKRIIANYEDMMEEVDSVEVDPVKWYYKWERTLTRAQACIQPGVAASGSSVGTGVMKSIDYITEASARTVRREHTSWKPIAVNFWQLGREGLEYLVPDAESQSGDSCHMRRKSSTIHYCPCRRKKHPWPLEECRTVEHVITGASIHSIKAQSLIQCIRLRDEMQGAEWKELRR